MCGQMIRAVIDRIAELVGIPATQAEPLQMIHYDPTEQYRKVSRHVIIIPCSRPAAALRVIAISLSRRRRTALGRVRPDYAEGQGCDRQPGEQDADGAALPECCGAFSWSRPHRSYLLSFVLLVFYLTVNTAV